MQHRIDRATKTTVSNQSPPPPGEVDKKQTSEKRSGGRGKKHVKMGMERMDGCTYRRAKVLLHVDDEQRRLDAGRVGGHWERQAGAACFGAMTCDGLSRRGRGQGLDWRCGVGCLPD